MAGPFDSIMKRMIGLHPEDFVQWLDAEATFVQALDIELKSQHIFADALLRITKSGHFCRGVPGTRLGRLASSGTLNQRRQRSGAGQDDGGSAG